MPLLTYLSTKRNQRNSPLLRLPAELRNYIYNYVLGGNFIVIHRPTSDLAYPDCVPMAKEPAYRANIYSAAPRGSNHPGTYPASERENQLRALVLSNTFALLKVCRQIYDETRLLPIVLNVIAFAQPPLVDVWLSAVDSATYNAVQILCICTTDANLTSNNVNIALLQRLRTFKGPREVEMLIKRPRGGSGGTVEENKKTGEEHEGIGGREPKVFFLVSSCGVVDCCPSRCDA